VNGQVSIANKWEIPEHFAPMNLNTDGLAGSIDIASCDNEGWRECAVAVRADGFTGEYVCSVRDDELRQFITKLEVAASNIGQTCDIEFHALERGFGFEIHLDARGHVDGKYEFGRSWRGPFLSGSFSADQTHLRTWAKELRAALQS
jgi:hypothetical protein